MNNLSFGLNLFGDRELKNKEIDAMDEDRNKNEGNSNEVHKEGNQPGHESQGGEEGSEQRVEEVISSEGEQEGQEGEQEEGSGEENLEKGSDEEGKEESEDRRPTESKRKAPELKRLLDKKLRTLRQARLAKGKKHAGETALERKRQSSLFKFTNPLTPSSSSSSSGSTNQPRSWASASESDSSRERGGLGKGQTSASDREGWTGVRSEEEKHAERVEKRMMEERVARRKTMAERARNNRATNAAMRGMTKAVANAEQRKRLDQLSEEGYVNEADLESHCRKAEERWEKQKKELKNVIAISHIADTGLTYSAINQRLLSESDCELDQELSYFDPIKGAALLVPQSDSDFYKADQSIFLNSIGTRTTFTKLALSEIAGEAKPWGVITGAADLPLEEVISDARLMRIEPKVIRRAGPVIIVEFWREKDLTHWATGSIETLIRGQRRVWKRERSFLADGNRVRWMGFVPDHVKRNSDIETAIKEAYGADCKVSIIRDPTTNRSKGCFYARFKSVSDLAKTQVRGANKINLFGQSLRVDKLRQQTTPEEGE